MLSVLNNYLYKPVSVNEDELFQELCKYICTQSMMTSVFPKYNEVADEVGFQNLSYVGKSDEKNPQNLPTSTILEVQNKMPKSNQLPKTADEVGFQNLSYVGKNDEKNPQNLPTSTILEVQNKMPKVGPSPKTADEVDFGIVGYVGKSVEKIDENLPTRKVQHEQSKMPKSNQLPKTADEVGVQNLSYVGKCERKMVEKLPTSNFLEIQNKMPKSSPLLKTVGEEGFGIVSYVGKKERKMAENLPTWITPKHENTLYWCVFLLQYGMQEYLAIGSKYKNAEVEEKMRVLDGLQKNIKSLKSSCYKLTNDMSQQLLSSLMVNVRDDFLTLIGYCVYYNLHVVVLMENNSYLTFSPQAVLELQWNEDLPWYQIKYQHGSRYNVFSVDVEPLNQNAINEIKNTRVRHHSYNAPLRGVSSYRVAELESMAKRLNIPIVGRKEELYAKVAQILVS